MQNKPQNSKQKITENSKIAEVIEIYPEVVPILLGYGLHCVGCSFSSFDTLKSAVALHGMSPEDFQMMLKDLNTIVEEGLK